MFGLFTLRNLDEKIQTILKGRVIEEMLSVYVIDIFTLSW